MSSNSGPQHLRGSLERVLTGLGVPEIEAVGLLINQWSEVVGPELASRVRAIVVRGSELVVQVEDPAWASQIAWLENRLLERIEDLVGPGRITAVRARITPRTGPLR